MLDMQRIVEEIQAQYDNMAKDIPVSFHMDPQWLQGFSDCLSLLRKLMSEEVE